MKKIWDLVGSNERECSFIKKEEYDNKNILSDEFGYEFHRLGFSISVDCKSLLIKNIFFLVKIMGKDMWSTWVIFLLVLISMKISIL